MRGQLPAVASCQVRLGSGDRAQLSVHRCSELLRHRVVLSRILAPSDSQVSRILPGHFTHNVAEDDAEYGPQLRRHGILNGVEDNPELRKYERREPTLKVLEALEPLCPTRVKHALDSAMVGCRRDPRGSGEHLFSEHARCLAEDHRIDRHRRELSVRDRDSERIQVDSKCVVALVPCLEKHGPAATERIPYPRGSIQADQVHRHADDLRIELAAVLVETMSGVPGLLAGQPSAVWRPCDAPFDPRLLRNERPRRPLASPLRSRSGAAALTGPLGLSPALATRVPSPRVRL